MLADRQEFAHPDTSTLRLRVLKEQLEEQYHSDALLAFTEKLSPDQKQIFTQLSDYQWISGSLEADLLGAMCEEFSSWRLLISAGKACFNQILEHNSFEQPEVFRQWELLLQLPWYVGLITNRLRMSVHESTDGSVHLVVRYLDALDRSSLIDVLFYEGLIRAFCQHHAWDDLDIKVTKTTLLQQDWPTRAAIHSGIIWGQGVHEYKISGDLLHEQISIKQNPEQNPSVHSDEQVQSILAKSAKLLEDKRELTTSVEFLHMANAELEKKIAVSQKELKMARNIQKGFVPSRLPDWKGLQFWVKFYPMTEVSGDFYDYFTFGANRLGILVCDVSGHGVPAALITAIAKLSFNSHKLDSPAEVYTRVNLDMLRYVKQEGYLTGFYMIIDAEYNITYSRAAGPVAIILRAKNTTIERLDSKGTLLGMFPDANRHIEDQHTRLEPGDKLFIFTDGVTEGVNTNDEMYGDERIINSILETVEMDVQEASEHVMQAFEKFTLGTDAGDDITLLTLMLSKRQGEFTRLISEARTFYFDKQYNKACDQMRAAIAIFPRHTTGLYLLARYLVRDSKYKEAMEYINQYNSLQPYNADAYTLLARCSYELGYYQPAIQHLKRSLSLRTENPRALYLMARACLKVNNRAEAEDALAQLIAINPDNKYTIQIQNLLN